MFYVTMTDKFMSGWGMSQGKINKMVVSCDTLQQAEQIAQAARKRSEMRRVNIRTTAPSYGKHILTSWKTWEELGSVWKGGMV
jgi:hypothetical protein